MQAPPCGSRLRSFIPCLARTTMKVAPPEPTRQAETESPAGRRFRRPLLHDRPQRRAVHPVPPRRLASAPVSLALARRRRGGVARPRHSVERRGRRARRSGVHHDGLSVDGTTAYLDEIAADEPERIIVYRKPAGRPGTGSARWSPRRSRTSARSASSGRSTRTSYGQPSRSSRCDSCSSTSRTVPQRTTGATYFVGPEAVVSDPLQLRAESGVEWLRTWRYRPGDRWEAHEPRRWSGGAAVSIDVGKKRPFLQDETEDARGPCSSTSPTQPRSRFGSRRRTTATRCGRGVAGAQRRGQAPGPVTARGLPAVGRRTTRSWTTRRARHVPLARRSGRRQPGRSRPGADDDAPTRGVGRRRHRRRRSVLPGLPEDRHRACLAVVLQEWLKTGFAERSSFSIVADAGPRLPGLPTRSIPLGAAISPPRTPSCLQRICDEEGAALFVSTYYTHPIGDTQLMLVYDMIPERLGLDMSDPVWDEKRLAIEHASSLRMHLGEHPPRPARARAGAAGKRGERRTAGGRRLRGRTGRRYRAVPARARSRAALLSSWSVSVAASTATRTQSSSSAPSATGRAPTVDEIVCVGGQPEIEPEFDEASPRGFGASPRAERRGTQAGVRGSGGPPFPSRYEGFGLPVARGDGLRLPGDHDASRFVARSGG